MISFKEFLSESIIVGSPVGNKTFAVPSARNMKYILMINSNSNEDYISSINIRFNLGKNLLSKIVDAITSSSLSGGYYNWADQITINLNKIKFSVNDFEIIQHEGKNFALPKGYERVAIEQLVHKIKNDPLGIISPIRSELFYGKIAREDPTLKAAQNNGDIEGYKAALVFKLKDMNLYAWAQLTALSYVVLDNTKKIIRVVDNTKKYNTRMSPVIGNTTYVLPMNDFSMGERDLVHLVTALVKQNKAYRSYLVPDIYTAIDKSYTAGDIVDGIGRIAENVSNFDRKYTNKPIKVYHGTSTAVWKNYISKVGLRPGQGVEYVDKIKGHSENLVYLTHTIGEARKYAVRAGKGMGSVVLEVSLNDMSKIKFDEDQLYYAFRKMPDKVTQEVKLRLKQLWPNEPVLMSTDPNISITDNPINTYYIRKLFDSPLNLSQRNLLNFIGSYAVTTKNDTFGYSGYILPKNIRVAEEFKSASTKEGDKDYNIKYDKVLSTFKSIWK